MIKHILLYFKPPITSRFYPFNVRTSCGVAPCNDGAVVSQSCEGTILVGVQWAHGRTQAKPPPKCPKWHVFECIPRNCHENTGNSSHLKLKLQSANIYGVNLWCELMMWTFHQIPHMLWADVPPVACQGSVARMLWTLGSGGHGGGSPP